MNNDEKKMSAEEYTKLKLMQEQIKELEERTKMIKLIKIGAIIIIIGALITFTFKCVMSYWIYDIIFQYIDWKM